MATPDKPSSKTPVRHAPLWERLQQLFSRSRLERDDEEAPHRRGVAITISVAVSILLWFLFTMQETFTNEVLMPTEVVNLPEGEALSRLPPAVVRVQVQGEGLSLLRLSLNPPTVPINASLDEIDLEGALPELPKNVRPLSVSPNRFNIQKERRITRKVPILLRADIDTPATHDLVDAPRIEPDSVLVTGAASIVSRLSGWPTVRVSFDNLRDSLVTRVPLADTLGGLVRPNIEATMLTAVSDRFTQDTREIEVTVTDAYRGTVALDPQTVRVRYRVLFTQFEAAKHAMDFFATVPYARIRSDTTGRVRPDIHLPQDIVLRDVEVIPSTLGYYERIE